MTAAYRRLARAYRRLGLVGMLRAATRLPATTISRRRTARWEQEFDAKWGMDTAGIVRLTSLEIESENRERGERYQATDPTYFQRLLEYLHVDLREFVFVDLGSGKGRALVLAAQKDFRRIIGVEFSPDLNAVARQNIQRLPQELRPEGRIETLTMDATRFAVPLERLVVFFFNPFDDDVLGEVLDSLIGSVRQQPRTVFLLFTGPLSVLPGQRKELVRKSVPDQAGIVYEVVVR